jgi:hypothetical protein
MPDFAGELADELKSLREGTLARIDVIIPLDTSHRLGRPLPEFHGAVARYGRRTRPLLSRRRLGLRATVA